MATAHRSSCFLLAARLGRLTLLTLLPLQACLPARQGARAPERGTEPVSITILSTTDVHGWLNPLESKKSGELMGGLSELAGMWAGIEGYVPDTMPRSGHRRFLVLDSGDMWTGPPESTLAQGRPVVAAFNHLQYDAVALGNHEFDFGIEQLRANARDSEFPYLCSNVLAKTDGPEVDFCRPTALIELQGIKLGLIGVSTIETPRTTWPKAVEGLEFQEYTKHIRVYGRQLVQQGAQHLIILAHEGPTRFSPIVEELAELPIRVVLGGHWHQEILEVIERDPSIESDDVIVMSAGYYARAYGRIRLTFQGSVMLHHAAALVPVKVLPGNRIHQPDPEVVRLGTEALERVKEKMSEPVGVAGELLKGGPPDDCPLGYLITDAWLESFPEAEIALTNRGGIRSEIEAGPVTLGQIFNVLPFLNSLVQIELSPAQLRQVLSNPKLIPGGIRYHYRESHEGNAREITRIEDRLGRPLEEGRTYKVLITDFLYLGGDNLHLQELDPTPLELGVLWREPLVRYFLARGQVPVRSPRESRAIRE